MPTIFTGANSTPPAGLNVNKEIDSKKGIFIRDIKVEIDASKELYHKLATKLNLGKIENNTFKNKKDLPTKQIPEY